jgi:hypothetical protein
MIGRMASADDNPPLVNNPAREAVASMRGYWAPQAWIQLADTDRLYLEGAEDFDRISGLTVETVQVKDVVRNVTLRSADVIDAIDNAWAHRQRNPRHTIRFRFLTTAGIGVEQGSPFGTGIRGLRLWHESQSSGPRVCRLAAEQRRFELMVPPRTPAFRGRHMGPGLPLTMHCSRPLLLAGITAQTLQPLIDRRLRSDRLRLNIASASTALFALGSRISR